MPAVWAKGQHTCPPYLTAEKSGRVTLLCGVWFERAHNNGWTIEVVSWDACCNRHLKAFAEKNGTYRSLEPVYEQVTFINNGRRVKPL
jgi:hypothetical protein